MRETGKLMNNQELVKGDDIVYSLIKAGIASIPLFGAAATELFTLIISSPLDRRRRKWMNEIAKELTRLELENKIDFLKLQKNDHFIDILIQATHFALKTSEVEKINAFKAAIGNMAINETQDKTKNQIFLNFIDSFTVWHLKVLHFINNPREWFSKTGQKLETQYLTCMHTMILVAFPSFQFEEELLFLIWNDLLKAGLHQLRDIRYCMLPGDIFYKGCTAQLGKEFIYFITEH